MLFHKAPYAANFVFAEAYDAASGKLKVGRRNLDVQFRAFEGDVYHLQITGEGLGTEDHNLVALLPPNEVPVGATSKVKLNSEFEITVHDEAGNVLLETPKGFGFGVCAGQSMFAFAYAKEMRFYGQGEKTYGRIELSHMRSRFWNTDALGDFHYKQWTDSACDPYYVSVPYLILRRGETYIGLLWHNPYETWIDTGTDPSFFGTEDANRKVVLGTEGGIPSLWIIVGPTLQELTRKLQKLVGVTPRPPLWSLGYHQCRWEYKGEKHLKWLNDHMVKHKIPNDGLWLDIDYMEGYRVFTYDKDAFPEGPEKTCAKYAALGRKVVPIIDPGVKLEPGNPVYEDGLKKNVFCLTPEGKPYVGFVWPGETVFPDFSKPEARTWWAGYAKSFKALGFGGAWVDMNDPSTGAVDPYAMLFRDGTLPHGAFRNQYALGMQMATRDGFQQASPNERIFILSRSGYTGTSRFAAIWTGDNVSNRWYLKGTIPTTLNLSLSGIPFNGPDVGGFMNDTNEELMIDWVKSGFLFPFFRNHSGGSHRRQEPWTFSEQGLHIITWYTSLRYKLMPYLYQLFVQQERDGDPILRPVQYHYAGGEIPDDVFLVGESILQAPVLEESGHRQLDLPAGQWFDARWGKWVSGHLEAVCGPFDTPLYFRDQSIVPTLTGVRRDNAKDLRDVEFHVFLSEGEATVDYVFDDGETLDFQSGKQSVLRVTARRSAKSLDLTTSLIESGFGDLKSTKFFLYGDLPKQITLNGAPVKLKREKITWTGVPMSVATLA